MASSLTLIGAIKSWVKTPPFMGLRVTREAIGSSLHHLPNYQGRKFVLTVVEQVVPTYVELDRLNSPAWPSPKQPASLPKTTPKLPKFVAPVTTVDSRIISRDSDCAN
jgi:hypothetical protein